MSHGEQLAPGQDSEVEDWFGQSVDRHAAMAETLSEQLGQDDAEAVFDEMAT